MTVRKNIRIKIPTAELIILVSLFTVLTLSDELSTGALSGLVLCAGTVIPAVFPFMVLGDAVSHFIMNTGLGVLESPLYKFFGLTRAEGAIGICGLICGFPAAARIAAEAYQDGKLSNSDAIRISALTSNPSPPFIIGAVGAGLLSDKSQGIALLISLLVSVLVTGLFFGNKRQKTQFSNITSRQKFDFLASVKNAGAASITVFAFVVFFSAIAEVLHRFVVSAAVFSFIIPFLEVSTATRYLICNSQLPAQISHLLLGFALGFGGLSANLQCISFLSAVGLSKKKFIIIKLVLGITCAIVSTLILNAFNI